MLLSTLLPLMVASLSGELKASEMPSASKSNDTEDFERGRPLWQAPEGGEPAWKGALSLGATFVEGNTGELSLAFIFDIKRRTEIDRLTFDAYYNYGKASVGAGPLVETVENAGAGIKYDYFLDDKTYALANTSVQMDNPAGVDSRTIVGAGVGRQVRDDETFEWGVEGGLSNVTQILDNTPDSSYLGLRLASNLAYTISESASFEQITEYLPNVDDFGELYLKLDNRLKMSISENWIGMFSWVFEYTDPIAGDHVDQRLVFTLGWSFGS